MHITQQTRIVHVKVARGKTEAHSHWPEVLSSHSLVGPVDGAKAVIGLGLGTEYPLGIDKTPVGYPELWRSFVKGSS